MPGHKRNAVTYSIIKGSLMQELTFEQMYLKKMKKDEWCISGRICSM